MSPPAGYRVRGRNSVVECSLPKADVVGSNPMARSLDFPCCGGTEIPVLTQRPQETPPIARPAGECGRRSWLFEQVDPLAGLTRSDIESLIPHRDPALWLDEVIDVQPNTIHCRRLVDPAFDWFRGHYPGQPILPGVLLCEACMQAGAVLIARHPEGALGPGEVPVATRLNNVKFKSMVRPGDTIDIHVTLTERLANAFYMTGKVLVGGKTAVTLEFACSAAPAPAPGT